jgi:tRNA(Ile)-lysidine synthase
MNKLLETVRFFLKKELRKIGPLLLGYSGGPDSKALLYSLLCFKKELGLDIHVAHVDHKWRENSTEQAEALKKEIEGLNLPFYLETLPKLNKEEKCLEARYRDMRFNFFKRLMEEYKFEALLLAHHQDDLVETVLKRIFEGANLSNLGGMDLVSKRDNITIWRPLLNVDKKSIFSFLQEEGIGDFIEDETNNDTHFLRARMRVKIIPYLEELFGKNIKNSLSSLSSGAYELRRYLDKRVEKLFKIVKRGPFGIWVNCDCLTPLEDIEIGHFLRSILAKEGILLDRDNINLVVSWVKTGVVDKRLILKEFTIIVDHGWLFMLHKIPVFSRRIILQEGDSTQEGWKIEVSKGKGKKSPSRWGDFLSNGNIIVSVTSRSDYGKLKDRKKRFGERFAKEGVPLFLRTGIYCDNELLHPFFIEGDTKDDDVDYSLTIALNK